jgi:hypothetical protein
VNIDGTHAVKLIGHGYTPAYVERQQAEAKRCGVNLTELLGDVDGQIVYGLALRWGLSQQQSRELLAEGV